MSQLIISNEWHLLSYIRFVDQDLIIEQFLSRTSCSVMNYHFFSWGCWWRKSIHKFQRKQLIPRYTFQLSTCASWAFPALTNIQNKKREGLLSVEQEMRVSSIPPQTELLCKQTKNSSFSLITQTVICKPLENKYIYDKFLNMFPYIFFKTNI